MSVNGSSALGTLLVQRIDAMLGTTLSQQANLVNGARPDAVTQPGTPDRTGVAGNPAQRDTQQAVDQTRAQTESTARGGVERGKLDARTAEILLGRTAASTSTTPSAPTRLGFAAQTILALLAAYPDQSPVVPGRRPLLNSAPGGKDAAPGKAGQAAGQGDTGTVGSGTSAASTGAGAAAGSGMAAGAGAANGPQAQNAQGQGGNAASGGAAAAETGDAEATQTGNRATAAGRPATNAPDANSPAAAALRAMATAGSARAAVVGQLVNALSQALQSSGMFYESHLGDLAFGRATANQIKQEPQAQLPAGASASGSAAGQNVAAQNLAAAQPAAPPAGAAVANAGAGSGAAITGQPANSSVPQAPASSQTSLSLNQLDPQTHTLVRQQLDVLANQTFAWRGELWPNAPMDWEIARRDAWKELDGTEHPEHWATRLTVNLPSLGQVQARITLANNQLVMHLVSPEAHGLLSERAEELRARYRSQGLQLSQLSVAAIDAMGETDSVNPTEATGNGPANDTQNELGDAPGPQGAP